MRRIRLQYREAAELMAPSSASAKFSLYDAFLCFREEDICEKFIGHLYEALLKRGIIIFQDDKRLEHGTAISKEILKGIDESIVAVIIFSRNYASSSRCLDELVKIMECWYNCRQAVIPVFYDVKPSQVQNQSKSFAEAFAKHELKYKDDVEGMQKVKGWRTALTEVAKIPGFDIHDGTESDFIRDIVDQILSKLHQNSLFDLPSVVGIDTHLEKVISLLKMEINDVQFVGIWGVEGVGKTTIAKAIFNTLSHQFEAACFLVDIKKNKCGMHYLQNILVSKLLRKKANFVYDKDDGKHLIARILRFKKVLIVLDGIDHKDHLDYLAGDLGWFGNGSRIIATTRDRHLIGKNVVYEVSPLADHEAIQLFNQQVFGKGVPDKCFEKFTLEIVHHAKGIPLALTRWGSVLYKTSITEWRSAIDKMKYDSNSREQSRENLALFPRRGNPKLEICRISVEGTVSSFEKHLVGIKSRVKDVKSLLNVELGGVYFVGIWGISGSGKTTVARAIFNEISGQFEGSCFLSNVREISKRHGPGGTEHVQKKLLSQTLKQHSLSITSANEGVKMISRMLSFKKVLIVLDDVDNDDQLESLVGKRNWFGDGSRIITTTRNIGLLRKHDELYRVPELSIDEALELFCWHAFQQGTPDKEFENLSICVVIYVDGLPLALEVLGSFLYKEGTNVWRSALDKLKDIGDGKVIKQLSLSLEGLSHEDKDIFLGIACSCRGKMKDDVITKLNKGFKSEIGIDILVTKSLLYISEGMVEMHDLIEQMGQQVARDINQDQPWKHSRLWQDRDIETVFSENLWTESVKAITVPIGSDQHICKWSKAFRNLPCLRLLIVRGEEVRLYEPVSSAIEYLPSSLKWLDWSYYSFESLPANFQPRNLVGLNMTFSSLVEVCNEPKAFNKLTILNLSFSENLLRTPNFSETPNLRRIILKSCSSLVKVHTSIGNLKKLIFLNMENCKNLEFLLNSIQMESLEILNLSGCEKLKKFPEIRGKMELLSELLLGRTAVSELPSSIGLLIGISLLDLHSCKNVVILPARITEMKKLKILILKGCSKLATVPENLGDLEELEELYARNTMIWQLPDFVVGLSRLKVLSLGRGRNVKCSWSLMLPIMLYGLFELKRLDLSGCNIVGKDVYALGSLSSLLELNLTGNKLTSLSGIDLLLQLRYLNITHCQELRELPQLPHSLKELYAEDFLGTQSVVALWTCPLLYLVSFTNYSFGQQSYTEKSIDNSVFFSQTPRMMCSSPLTMTGRGFQLFFLDVQFPRGSSIKVLRKRSCLNYLRIGLIIIFRALLYAVSLAWEPVSTVLVQGYQGSMTMFS